MIRQLLVFFDCPQIRWSTDDYDYRFWLYMRRKGEFPNTILSLSRKMSRWVWEDERYDQISNFQKKEFDWCLWSNE